MVKKILVIGIIILFLGACVTHTVAIDNVRKSNSPGSSGNTLYVGGYGEGNYTNIQDAIDDSIDGDTIFVYDDSSPYYESLEIDKSINLVGENKNSTIIDGNGSSLCVWIRDCQGGSLKGFTIQNARDEGVYARNCKNMNFSGNVIRNNGVLSTHGPLCGMRISESKNCIVSGNIFKNNLYDGLMVFSALSDNIIITGNVFENNSNFGLWLCSSNNDVVTENIFRNNRCGGIEISSKYSMVYNNSFESNGIVMMYSAIVDYTMIHTIENNTINGKQIRYYKNISGITVPEDTGQVIATNCNNLTIKNLTLSDASIGIELLNCAYCDIYNNTIVNNSLHGISLVNTYDLPDDPISLKTHSNSNIISRNNISNNWDGIMIFNSCRNNSIFENNFENNTCAINITWSIDYHNYHFPAGYQIKTKPRLLNFFNRPFFLLFKRNDFNKNNFFENKEHVTFEYNSFFFARWRSNYWDEPRDSPYPIYGTLAGYNWINIDWRPAKEPYEI